MDITLDLNRIGFDERIGLKLRNIYESYGYTPYKMSKFEEYELYAKNKDFLGDGGILTFTDVNGKLMALKPDVTLSIVKNFKRSVGVQKTYYREKVYRTLRHGGGFGEIDQSGIECIGDISEYDIIEVLLLALKSLEATERPFKLVISHMGIVSSLVEELAVSEADKEELFTCIKRKNADGIRKIAAKNGINGHVPLADAVEINDNSLYTINALRSICSEHGLAALDQLERLIKALNQLGYGERIGIDLSVINDMNYYRSLVFRGYVDCIPEGILFGGRYDDLVKKMGRNCGAIGFAVSTDKLSSLSQAPKKVLIDVLVVYSEQCSTSAILDTCNAIRNEGKTVIALNNFEPSLSVGQVIYLDNDGNIYSKECK